MLGAALIYNLIIAEQARWDERVIEYRKRFAKWAETVTVRLWTVKEWNRQRFWKIAEIGNRRISSGAHEFINAWWDLAIGSDAPQLRDSTSARKLITARELRLKKNLARIGNPRAQELWNGDSGSAPLEFRWLISQRLLSDIYQGLETADA